MKSYRSRIVNSLPYNPEFNDPGTFFQLSKTKIIILSTLTLYHTIPMLDNLGKEDFLKQCGKRKKC